MLSSLFHVLMLIASAQTSSQSKLLIEPCKTAEVYAFSKSDCLIKLFNSGEKPIHILNLQADSEGDLLPSIDEVVQPGSERFLMVGFSAGNAIGTTYHTYRLRTDELAFEARTFGIRAFALSAFEEYKPELDFGVVNAVGQSSAKLLEFHAQEAAHWQITRVLETPSWLDVKLANEGHGIEANVKRNSAWGLQTGFVKLAVDVAEQSQLWVWVKADVRGNIIPASNPFDVGVLRFGNHNEFKVELTERSGKAFETANLHLKDIEGEVKTVPCTPARVGCELLKVTVSDRQPAGSIRGYIQLSFPDHDQELSILVTGLILDPSKKIIDLNSAEARASVHTASTSVSNNPIDVTHEIQMVVQEAEVLPPPGTGPLLKWKVANGAGIHGFQIFRADDEAGPFVLVNRETIRSRSVSSESQDYQFRDNSVVSGKTYWYYIGIVYADGHKQQLTGPQKVVAK